MVKIENTNIVEKKKMGSVLITSINSEPFLSKELKEEKPTVKTVQGAEKMKVKKEKKNRKKETPVKGIAKLVEKM